MPTTTNPREWVTPEPGAGLIRDTPKLIAPSELFAYPGRGGLLVYALDEKGNRIPETEKKDQPRQTRRRRNRRRAAGGMGGMTGGMMGNRKKATKSRADLEREAKAEEERKRRELLGKLVPDDAPPDTAKKDESTEDQGPPAKEIVKGYRWVAITGVLDHEKMRTTIAKRSRTPRSRTPTICVWTFSVKHFRPMEAGRSGRMSMPTPTFAFWITSPSTTKNLPPTTLGPTPWSTPFPS